MLLYARASYVILFNTVRISANIVHIKFCNLPKIWSNTLLAEFKFGDFPERVLITLIFGKA